jgi:predicted Zn-dependent peptidase
MIASSTLPNGVRIFTEAMPGVRSATIGIWADVGSAAEPAERLGVSHLVEHMLFKGTQRRTSRQIAEEMDGIGGNLNAFTDKESTCYYAHVMDRHLPIAIDVLGDMFLHSLFDEAELRKEQHVVLEEIKMYDDSPDEMIHDLFTRTMWRGSHLGEPTIGYAQTVTALDPAHLRGWMAQRYAPQTVIVTAAGNLAHDEVVDLVARAFEGFAGAAVSPVADRPQLTPDVAITFKETEQAYVLLGSRGLSLRDADRYTLSVLDTILGGGMSSRLFQEVREKRGLAYSVYSFQQSYRDAGLFGVYAGTSPDRVQECVDVICGELDAALAGVTEAEVALAREHIKGNLTLALESTSSRMMRLGRNELVYGRQIAVEEIEAEIDAVDRAAVEAVARVVLAPETRGLCVLGPIAQGAIRFTPARAA